METTYFINLLKNTDISEEELKEIFNLLSERASLLKISNKFDELFQEHAINSVSEIGKLKYNSTPDTLIDSKKISRKMQKLASTATQQTNDQIISAPTVQESPKTIEEQNKKIKEKKKKGIAEGTIISGYKIISLLGAGGMGQVYKAQQISLDRTIALKILPPKLALNDKFRERFMREAKSAGQLHHKNLIAVHDVDEKKGILFFSMDFIEGRSIGDILEDQEKIDEDSALAYTKQALEGLAYAHAKGVIHRDIKPDNLMLSNDEKIKIADLGLVRMDDSSESSITEINDEDSDNTKKKKSALTLTGTMMGTPYYMPPEQGRDAHTADARADIYSLGATLYHMVCGKVPFTGDSPVSIVVNASTNPLEFPSSPSPAVKRLIQSMMEKEPEKRPQSANDCIAMLDALVAKKNGFVPKSTRIMKTLLTLLIIILIIIASVFIYNKAKRPAKAWNTANNEINKLLEKNNFQGAKDRVKEYCDKFPYKMHKKVTTKRKEIIQKQEKRAKDVLDKHKNDFAKAKDIRSLNQTKDAIEKSIIKFPSIKKDLEKLRNEIKKLLLQKAKPKPSKKTSESDAWKKLFKNIKVLEKQNKYKEAREELVSYRTIHKTTDVIKKCKDYESTLFKQRDIWIKDYTQQLREKLKVSVNNNDKKQSIKLFKKYKKDLLREIDDRRKRNVKTMLNSFENRLQKNKKQEILKFIENLSFGKKRKNGRSVRKRRINGP